MRLRVPVVELEESLAGIIAWLEDKKLILKASFCRNPESRMGKSGMRVFFMIRGAACGMNN
jgi:hypothetical protein